MMKGFRFILFLFIIWRIFLFFPLLFGYIYIPFQTTNKTAQLWAYTRPYEPVSSFLLYPWANFDGVHYLTVALDGYRRGAEGRFFPFYPFIIFLFSSIFGKLTIYGMTEFFSGLFVANSCFFLSLLVFYKLVRFDYSENTARWSLVFLLVFPVSFFYAALYSESIFLLLSILSFYFARKKNFLFAGIFGALTTLTRSVGVIIFLPLLYELYLANRPYFFTRKFPKSGLSLLLIPCFLCGFMVFNYLRWHDWFYFIHAQQAVTAGRSHIILFIPQTVYRYAKILLSLSSHQFEWWIALLEVCSFFAGSVLLYYAWKKRIRTSYLIFAFFCFLVPAVSGTFSGLPRYISVLFPLFILPGLLKNTSMKIFFCIICVVLLFLLTMFFSRGYLIS